MNKISALFAALVFSVSSISVAHAEEAPAGVPAGSSAPFAAVGGTTGLVVFGAATVALVVATAISSSNDDNGGSTPSSTSTSTSTR